MIVQIAKVSSTARSLIKEIRNHLIPVVCEFIKAHDEVIIPPIQMNDKQYDVIALVNSEAHGKPMLRVCRLGGYPILVGLDDAMIHIDDILNIVDAIERQYNHELN